MSTETKSLESTNTTNTQLALSDWKASIKLPPKDTRVKTEDVLNKSGLTFEDFDLKIDLLKGIFALGWEEPSPVQCEVIPVALMGKHALVRSKNGTGKTGSFVIPILNRIDTTQNYIQAIVIAPSRELAMQHAKFIRDMGKELKVEVVVVTGGTETRDDIVRLKGTVHVVVATPGRISDLLDRGALSLSRASMVALDEADKLLSVDTIDQVVHILERTPKTRQILMVSATFPVKIEAFVREWMRNCEQINLMEELTLKGITQHYVYLKENEKTSALRTLIRKLTINQAIIFCHSADRVEHLTRMMSTAGLSCYCTHGKMSQEDRNKVYHNFTQGNSRYLVATDLITRGIDVQGVNVVINFDFPSTSESYLHRIGRSGRFGHLGLAVNFVTDADKYTLYKIEQELDTEITAIPETVDKALYCI